MDSSSNLIVSSFSGINSDATMGYSDFPGFRCGTSHSYPAYDVLNNKILDIRISPLIMMDCALIENKTLNLNLEESLAYVKNLKIIVKSIMVFSTYYGTTLII